MASYIGTVPSRRFVWSEFTEEMNASLGKAVRVEKVRSTNTSAVIIDYDAFMRAYGTDFRRNEAADDYEPADPAEEQQQGNHKEPEEQVIIF